MSEETAKAVGKTADAVKEIAAAGRELGAWSAKIFGVSVDNVSGILSDWTKYWRYKNAIVIKERVERLHRERGITDLRPMPMRLGIPLLEAASLEDDPMLQEMWAALIANATDPGKEQESTKVFVRMLADFEPKDAIVLRLIIEKYEAKERKLQLSIVSALLCISESECIASLERLSRSGCLNFQPNAGTVLTGDDADEAPNKPIVTGPHGDYTITSLALDLMSACNPT